MLTSVLMPNEASPSSVEGDCGGCEFPHSHRREAFDPLDAGGECICQLARHRDDVALGGSYPGFGFGEGLCEPVQAHAQRRRDLDSIYNAAVLRTGGLEMGTSNVPSNENAHILPCIGPCDTFMSISCFL